MLLIKKGFGPVEMTCGLANASYCLPEWQAVKLTFFALCYWYGIIQPVYSHPLSLKQNLGEREMQWQAMSLKIPSNHQQFKFMFNDTFKAVHQEKLKGTQ